MLGRLFSDAENSLERNVCSNEFNKKFGYICFIQFVELNKDEWVRVCFLWCISYFA